MFVGTYYHSLDEKSRVSIPKAFRFELSPGSVITYGLDGCLFIFTADSWTKLTDKLQSLPLTSKPARDFLRLLSYHASPADTDKLGRVHLPVNLLKLAGIQKEVVFAGALSRVEIWAKSRYHAYLDGLAEQSGELEATLQELGI